VPAYGVGLRASAGKQLAALDKPIRERVAAAIDALAETRRPSRAIAMQGTAGLLRIRVGSYRVVYAVSDRDLIVRAVGRCQPMGHPRARAPVEVFEGWRCRVLR
jgi:mRNA interferase RelE/StbE